MRAWCAQAGGPGCGDVHTWALGLCAGVRRTQAGWRVCGGAHLALGRGCAFGAPGWQARLRGCARLGPWAPRGRTAFPGRVAGLQGRSHLALGFDCVVGALRPAGQAAGMHTSGPFVAVRVRVYPGRLAGLQGRSLLALWCRARARCVRAGGPSCGGVHTWVPGLCVGVRRTHAGWRVCRGTHAWLCGLGFVLGARADVPGCGDVHTWLGPRVSARRT